ncbi:MMPL family transporter [Streptomyces sp. XM4193]|uniref:MMPL family transporter n=1 Tax=Streptomyces sp. XM4193 TaxID=2929782 RepID=UPI001FF81472|nr:MMPL family transporter [Streptomyces sp. XM4193]MCK1798185.1 MMPL family transporter [Streptomyces sp. XM4193]
MALGPLAGKLGEVQDAGSNAFLPRSSESAAVNTELEKFRSEGELIPALVVYTGGESDERRAKAAADRRAFQEYAATGQRIAPPAQSRDGEAQMTVVPLSYDDDPFGALDEIREIAAANAPPGVEAHIGGPAGSLQDSVAVFDDIDGTLMAASALVVTLLLLLIYRSPVLWLVPLVAVAFAAVLTQVGTYLLARYGGLPVDPQSAGILMVLVFGIGTDYALLLIARYREELHRHEDRHEAMQLALHRCLPALLASVGTIAAGMCALALADINSSRSLGLVAAVGAACAFLALVTVLPALLVVAGRWVFWPLIPRCGAPVRGGRSGWARIADLVAARPRRSWLLSVGLTAVLALGAVGMSFGLNQSEQFQTEPESVVAQERVSAHYASGASDPAVVVARADAEGAVTSAVERVDGVDEVSGSRRTADGALVSLDVVLEDAPDSEAAKETVAELRTAVHAVDGADALVGGVTAETVDTQRAAARDLVVVIPVVLLVVLGVLIWLLRSLVAPVLLLACTVASNLAALGASYFLFVHVLGFAGIDWSIPLMGFVFLTALGIDYTIFLMTRVREEAALHGHERGVRNGLVSTGGVITSAGIVLAATFAVIGSMPLVTMAQLGVLAGVGVLLDTFLVRTVMVPALALDLGDRTWWPGRLSRPRRTAESASEPVSEYAPDGFPRHHPERV